jgi:sarcosine oxidase, subunit gamma
MHDQRLSLHIQWQTDLSVLSLRGVGADIAPNVELALGVTLPLKSNTTHERNGVRCVWVSPDDCFVLSAAGQAAAQEAKLREALQGKHFAVTDVSSGYACLSLSGTAARSVLAQGCPLDLHPSAFGIGQCAGSHFFKASVWLWLASDAPRFDVLVRRSFAPYVDALLRKASLEYRVERAGAKIGAYA